MNKRRINHLKELNKSDYKIADDQPNINNWTIYDSAGKKVGKVKDMLFDEQAHKVRYIITNLKNGEVYSDDRNVLIPIGRAQLNTSKERIMVPNVNQNHLSTVPQYRNTDTMTQEDEVAIRNAYSTGGTTATADTYDRETFYSDDAFDEEKFYNPEAGHTRDNLNHRDEKVDVIEEDVEVGKKEVQTGGAKVSSRIVERPVEERIKLKEEDVKVKRNPVDRPADSADLKGKQGKTITETETKEVPVVNKEARVVEEVSLEKDVNKKEEVIEDTVKETKVDVDKNIHRNDKDRTANTTERDRLDKDKNKNRNI
ncbi:PRC and DUF2382 domain-containing protein [Salegentibacter sp. F188]|uniref:PRC and DUF2382 domain-containing protein n=1 Tax=Autumnicola patrickiae TaxID=3075591 RepID=A0ABU3E4Y8_9FLAO|nr:PRC and DUF2382 domain-containing protein [Salegentibacter sp. F188]MDT0691005.1 PRC and DUF2382 domain-containing protein [Salegentibacter sp. F188]